MRETKFSTLTLLNIAAVVEEEFPNEFDNRYFDLDRLQDVLNDDKIFSDRDRRIIYLCFERDMAFDEIVAAENVSIEIVRYTIDIMYQKLFCFSKVYRGNSAIKDIAAYKLLDEGDTYLKLFGNRTYYEVARDYIRNERKFDLQMSRAHATIVALTLGFSGKEIDPRYVLSVERVAAEKFDLRYLDISISESSNEANATFGPYPDINTNIENLQSFLTNVLGRKVTASEEIDLRDQIANALDNLELYKGVTND